jgi:hypothetical protein
MAMTAVKASHAQGQSAKIRRRPVAGSVGDLCSMSNELEIIVSAALLRTGSSGGDGKGLLADKIRSELVKLR